LLGSYEVGNVHQINLAAILELNRRSTFPALRKRVDSAHFGHDVNANQTQIRPATAKVDSQTQIQVLLFKGRNSYHFCLKIVERPLQQTEIGASSQHGNVGIAAKLGRAVEHARLPPHKQVAN